MLLPDSARFSKTVALVGRTHQSPAMSPWSPCPLPHSHLFSCQRFESTTWKKTFFNTFQMSSIYLPWRRNLNSTCLKMELKTRNLHKCPEDAKRCGLLSGNTWVVFHKFYFFTRPKVNFSFLSHISHFFRYQVHLYKILHQIVYFFTILTHQINWTSSQSKLR